MAEFNIDIYKNRSKDWLTFSAVSRTYPPSFSHELRKAHGGIKPPELIIELLFSYGKDATQILDPFVGVGSTLIASSLLEKHATGIDINQKWKTIYQQVCNENKLYIEDFIVGDSTQEIKKLQKDFYDFLITDVPYFSMDKLKKTRGKFSKAGEISKDKLKSSLNTFNELPLPSYDDWIILLRTVFSDAFTVLKHNSRIIVFIGNMYRNFEKVVNNKKRKIGEYLLLSAQVAEILTEIGFQQINELIWVDTGKKLGIYGYPFTWIPSLIDQRILVFQKK